jgi:hypothetical protein
MDFKKMLEEKKSKKVDPMAKKAKMGVLGSLKSEMQKMMGDDVKGVKKVTVAAPDEESLESGLETAKELVGGEEPSHSYEDKVGMEMEKYKEDPSLANIQSLMACLEEKKAELLKD